MSRLDIATDRFRIKAENIVDQLRDEARKVERDAKRILDGDIGNSNELTRAGWTVNSLNYMFANLQAQDLMETAQDLREAREKGLT